MSKNWWRGASIICECCKDRCYYVSLETFRTKWCEACRDPSASGRFKDIPLDMIDDE